MITINMLEKTDVLTKGDWCRPLYLCTMSGGMSDSYSFESFGTPENNTKWCRVERIMPFWIGGTIEKFEKATEQFQIYEYMRGDVLKEHIHDSAEAPDYDANLKDGVYE